MIQTTRSHHLLSRKNLASAAQTKCWVIFNCGKPFWTYRYRALTLVCLGVSVLLGVYFVSLTRQPANHVIAAQASKKGFVSKVVMLRQDYSVPPELVKDFLKRYMHAWFKGNVGPKTLSQNQYFVETFSSEAVTKRFNAFMKAHALHNWNHPIVLGNFDVFANNIVKAEFHLPVSDASGKLVGYNTFNGSFKLVLGRHASAKAVMENPFGFYINGVTLANVKEEKNGKAAK